jgi:hypothetical protein
LYSGMSITTACSASGSISVVLAPPRFSTFLQPDNCGHYVTTVIIKPFLIELGTGFRNETTRNPEDTIKTPWSESVSELWNRMKPYSRLSRPEPLLFLPSSSSIVPMRLSGPRSRPTTSQKIR